MVGDIEVFSELPTRTDCVKFHCTGRDCGLYYGKDGCQFCACPIGEFRNNRLNPPNDKRNAIKKTFASSQLLYKNWSNTVHRFQFSGIQHYRTRSVGIRYRFVIYAYRLSSGLDRLFAMICCVWFLSMGL